MSTSAFASMASRFVLPAAPPALSRIPSSSVWLEFIALAKLTNSMNMAQGFPDWAPPRFLLDAVRKSCEPPPCSTLQHGINQKTGESYVSAIGNHANGGFNSQSSRLVGSSAENAMNEAQSLKQQYARSAGSPALVNAIARYYFHRLKPVDCNNLKENASAKQAREAASIDPMSQVLVTVGATQGLSLAISAMVGPGEEVVLIEPAFDIYTGVIQQVGAIPRYVSLTSRNEDGSALTSSDFVLDLDRLESVLNSKTRVLVLNTPHNPTGKVFSRQELTGIANLLERYPHVAVVSDEVYEHITFNPELPHIPFASLSPSTFERTISIYSAGKTFSATGWKVGWAIGPSVLIKRMHTLHQYTIFSVASILQDAVALALDAAVEPYEGFDSYYAWLAAVYKEKRDFFVKSMESVPDLEPVIPDGAFFVMARHSGATKQDGLDGGNSEMPADIWTYLDKNDVPYDRSTTNRKDYNFVRRLALERKVIAIPPSSFFCLEHSSTDLAANFARFSFCKRVSVLQEACKRLGDLGS